MKLPLKAHRGPTNLAIRMTPLIDVIFLLLIFFIMTIHFQRPEGVLANRLPEKGGQINISWRIDGARALVEAADNGGGFPVKKINDLQTKYYTTKGESGGMGLGLFITKNILEAHGGSLILENNKAQAGAVVTLAFPLLK